MRRDIAIGNGWLVACSAVHMGLACVLVKSHGAVGLIGADAVNMMLRIGFCLVFVARQFREMRGFQLRALFPSTAALGALAAASMVCLAADSVLFNGTALPKSLQVCPNDLLILCSSNEGHLLEVHVGRVFHQATWRRLAAATCVCLAAHSIYTNDIVVSNEFPDVTFCNCLAAVCTVSRSSAPQMALRLGELCE